MVPITLMIRTEQLYLDKQRKSAHFIRGEDET